MIRLLCSIRGHSLVFQHNLYGDQINAWNGNRSLWVCTKCGALKPRKALHDAAISRMSADGGKEA